ncbi:hypothetical protein EV424DRAFT_1437325 [Suillus variegatus]|nr:hypothetical protein EV424DRAFT_1437325 [Suillus variegatus]
MMMSLPTTMALMTIICLILMHFSWQLAMVSPIPNSLHHDQEPSAHYLWVLIDAVYLPNIKRFLTGKLSWAEPAN